MADLKRKQQKRSENKLEQGSERIVKKDRRGEIETVEKKTESDRNNRKEQIKKNKKRKENVQNRENRKENRQRHK